MKEEPRYISELPPIEVLLESRDLWVVRYMQLAEQVLTSLPEDDERRPDLLKKFNAVKEAAAAEAQAVALGMAALDVAADLVIDLIEENLRQDGETTEQLLERLMKQAQEKLAAEADEPAKPDPLGGADVAVPEAAFKSAG